LRARIVAGALRPVGRYLSGQAARPHGVVGYGLSRIWIRETAAVNDVAVALLAPEAGERVAEIGFGPGRTLARIAAAGAEVVGVEVSEAMISSFARSHAELLAAGRVHLHRGDGTTIPASDGSLDAALAVHTLYFWPDPAATVTDIARALRADGRLVLAFRAGEHPTPARFDPDIYHLPTTTEVTQWLTDAGFKDVQIQNHADISHAVAWAIGFKR
jgi:SAM-dependent methyltransferase